MKIILLFEPSEECRDALTLSLRVHLDSMKIQDVEFMYFNPDDVFTKPMPEEALAVFFSLSCMNDVETARHFNKLREEIPLVMVSDTDEFVLETNSTGAVFYLVRPIDEGFLYMALDRCVRGLDYFVHFNPYRGGAKA